MAALDAKMRALATRLLAKFGRDVDVSVTTGATYDRSSGSYTGGTITAATIKSSPPLPYDSRWAPGDVVVGADVVLILAAEALEAAGIVPVPGMTVETDSTTYAAVAVRRLASGEQDAAWVVLAKTGPGAGAGAPTA